jgi:hypothetical protein
MNTQYKTSAFYNKSNISSMSPTKNKSNNSFSKERVNHNLHNKIFTKKNERIEFFKTIKLRNDFNICQQFSIEFYSTKRNILESKIKELEEQLLITQQVILK